MIKKANKSGITPILLLTKILIIALIMYIALRNAIGILPTISLTTTPHSNPTENWKTYLNFTNDYKVKYPTNWEISEFQETVKLIPPEHISKQYVEDVLDNITIRPGSISEQTLNNSHKYQMLVSGNNITVQEGNPLVMKSDDPSFLRFTNLQNGQKSYVFSSAGSINRDVFNQILSTFEFIDNIDQKKAEDLIKKLPEVKTLLENNPKYVVEAKQDSIDNFWIVQVYESLETHNATYGWYKVDKNNGAITKILQ